jgi:hypothetical protein
MKKEDIKALGFQEQEEPASYEEPPTP